MKIQIEDIDSCSKKIILDIPHQDYKTQVNDYYRKLGREVNIPGFRKGKVPVSVLEKRFGPEVKREVLTQLISERVTEAIEEKGLRVVGAPSLLEVNAEEGTDINVSASVEIIPDFEVKDYSGIEMEMKIPKVTDEETDRVIEAYRQRAAKTIQVTDRPAQDKDYLKVDFKGTLDGQPFDGGEGKDHILQIGTGQFFPELEKALIGMQVGEVKNIPIHIPDDYFNKTIAGKEVNFQVTLKGIQVKELPELNDEFARNADPSKGYESVQDMKEKVHKEIEDYERKQARKTVKKQLAQKLAEMNPIDVPEGLVQDQIRFMAAEARKKQASQSGVTPAPQDAEAPVTEADQATYRVPAIHILQQELVLDKLAHDLDIQVSDKELNAEVEGIARLLGTADVQKIKTEWGKNGTLLRLHSQMKRDKTLEALVDKVTLREEMVDRKEIISDNES